jgi:chromosome segregation ATPase
MTRAEIKKMTSDNAELQRLLNQQSKKIDSLKLRIAELSKTKKAMNAQNERSKNKVSELKTALATEKKKLFSSS